MYILRKLFTSRKRKQNRRLARAAHNAEMHANKAAKAQEKAAQIVSNPANLVDEKKMEEAQKLSQKTQKSVQSSQHAAGQAEQQTKNISRTRKSVTTNPNGLDIKNQGAGDINVRKEGSNVVVHKKAPTKNGNTATTVKTTPSSSEVVVKKISKSGPSKVSTKTIETAAKKTQNTAEVAQKTTQKSKQLFKSAKNLMNTKVGKIAGGAALTGSALYGAKKLYDRGKE